MKIQTTRFGELEITEQSFIIFPNGIPGLEQEKEYVLLPADNNDETPFFFMQSVTNENLCFFLLDPFSFFHDYDVKIDDGTIEKLEINEEKDVLVFTIVTAKGSLKEATTNLKAPIIINNTKKLGKQIVLDNQEYIIKQPLFSAEKNAVSAGGE
ncbi:flagellar assembly protein FliW [Pseudalkalibacillus caeni]|uniref:Flagellar assembly factor FliW n=1 Tax=Exobacillus caeni TaxID=2574798 RepID=A0A5R9F298_9BACL|nr:flagellar assembly protein FliW [Pseudalkalibacillus caeni]TLS36610.1 flagellar assembly protein FliW [Pseudalkalibacillus caeni]